MASTDPGVSGKDNLRARWPEGLMSPPAPPRSPEEGTALPWDGGAQPIGFGYYKEAGATGHDDVTCTRSSEVLARSCLFPYRPFLEP